MVEGAAAAQERGRDEAGTATRMETFAGIQGRSGNAGQAPVGSGGTNPAQGAIVAGEADLPVLTPRDSAVETRYLLMPDQINHYGTAFGGIVMSWIDVIAGMAAHRHCGREVVTASIDHLSFLNPIHSGDHVVLKASVNYVGNTSLEVGVKVIKERPFTREASHTTTAYLTFVCLGPDMKPIPAPRLRPETPDELRRWENARLRMEMRRQLRDALKKAAETGSYKVISI